MLLTTILIFFIALLANLGDFFGTTFIGRPLVTGMLVGLVMGNLREGLMIGASLELVWMGLMGIGATIPPDVVSGGILGTAFALLMGKGIEVALTLALPIATLGVVIKNIFYVAITPALTHKADRYAEEGEITKAANMHIVAIFAKEITMSLFITISFYFGSSAISKILALIPQAFIDGMNVATGLIPAVGFAMLIGMTYSKKVAPFFFLGFVLAAYLKLPMLAVAIIGGICGIVMFIIFSEIDKNKTRVEVGSDEDF
ncbi:MAG: PTS sugar transporter subunit IIC [Bacillota bacterium]|nr:PTS sugar transporter subunit IIC [Bacillota bacterium]